MKCARIAHLIATNFYGGPERQIVNHALHLQDGTREYELMIISFLEDGEEPGIVTKARDHDVNAACLRAPGAFNVRLIRELQLLLKHHDVRLLVSHGYKANVIGRLASRLQGMNMVAVSRGWTSENWKIGLYQLIDKFFLRWASHVVAVSEGQRQKILRLGLPSEKVSVIHNAIDLQQLNSSAVKNSLRKDLGIPTDGILICSAGRLSPEKNQTILVEAAQVICRKRSDVYFCILGEGGCRASLHNKITRYGLEKRFFLPGFRKDLLSILHEVDIFALPSFSEGLPNVLLEAYGCGIPAVAADVGGIPEIIQHGVSGFLHHPEDLESLVGYLLQLADEPEMRLDFASNGHTIVADSFDYHRQTAKYKQLYTRFI